VAIVGLFAKVILAVAILVANGALLFFILRFLLWLAFPASKHEPPAISFPTPSAAPVTALGADEAAVPPQPAVPAALPVAGAVPVFAPVVPRPRAYPHRLLIGLPVILALFLGGVWLGSLVGGSGDASAATTIRVTGKVVTVNATKTEVRVPGTNVVVSKGSVVTLPAQTVLLPSHTVTNIVHRTRTQILTLPGSTTVITTTLTIPTTILSTGTVTVTETTTQTVTDTTGTGTTTTT
jgi:hypothetical protein